jgi:hypothetical protein
MTLARRATTTPRKTAGRRRCFAGRAARRILDCSAASSRSATVFLAIWWYMLLFISISPLRGIPFDMRMRQTD